MNYAAVKNYLESLANYEKNLNYSYQGTLKLKRIQDFLELVDNPQDSLRVIHVAGTKGKGSTCALVAYILRRAGFCVGLYTSPHLNDFRERIRILAPSRKSRRRIAQDFEGMISKESLTSLVRELKPIVNKYNRSSKTGQLSFFEVYTTLAFLYFKRRKVDFVVLETGLGGRLDATNAADSLVCGIAPLSFEHVEKLGHILAKIAAEKAGIIKQRGAVVISASQAKEAQDVIYNQCKKFQAKLYEIGKQIKYSDSGEGFWIRGFKNKYNNLHLNLLGTHQAANAALAVGLVEGLSFHGFKVTADAIRQGLKEALWPGRCELIQENPLIVLDGAQNAASAQVLSKAIKDNFKYQRLILVLGVSADKDIPGICKQLGPLADEVILTRASSPRAIDPLKLAACFKRKLYLTQSVKEAKLLAGNLAGKGDLILVTGSLFVVGEFRHVAR
ncbi:MAG: bifunctional folylpolyglutamate synthase/dihydrofolate synthase [Candidatus Omnitrophica bacterium CG11_big_fil_rev_8_21_14_0_20_43_6]|nr:MAG: bifunctional folylpolyglutamate synthase/dihydrofolate synthase [Candidatus Omnitrophica bacterium CG11_big_fil_rev_8_21_14_0_20_43_6]